MYLFIYYFTDKFAFRKSTHSCNWRGVDFINKPGVKKHVSWWLIYAPAQVLAHTATLTTVEAFYNPVSFCQKHSGK